MPELPEVETMRRGLLPIVGARIIDCATPPCNYRPISIVPSIELLRKRLLNHVIKDVGRRGKRVLLHLCDESVVVIEPRMTGLLLLEEPPNTAHLRLQIDLSDSAGNAHARWRLLFWDRRGLGTVRWLSKNEIDDVLGSNRLGPDALEILPEELRNRLGDSRRAVKVALLDQKIVAGIGNLYASEILFLAGVDPRTSCHRLSRSRWLRIHQAIGEVLHQAILHEGSTLSDGTYRNALNQAGNYQNHHRVYDSAGKMCDRCRRAEIVRIVQAQRCTFFCPVCQSKRGTAKKTPEAVV